MHYAPQNSQGDKKEKKSFSLPVYPPPPLPGLMSYLYDDWKIILCVFSVRPEEKPKEKVIPCQTKNRWILPPDAKVVNSLDRQAVEELLKGWIVGRGGEQGDGKSMRGGRREGGRGIPKRWWVNWKK